MFVNEKMHQILALPVFSVHIANYFLEKHLYTFE